MKHKLIESIASQMNIPIADGSEWISQTVYSLAGQMGLASLWDHSDDKNTVSIQHFKDRMKQVFSTYANIYPELDNIIPKDKNVLLDEIYSIYLRSGFFYHSAYQISPALEASSGYKTVTLHRGSLHDVSLFRSGLGEYSLKEYSGENTIAEMFGLQPFSFENYLEDLIPDSEWEPIVWPEKTEYLRLEPPFSRGYWKQLPDKDNRISLARFGEFKKQYVLYCFQDGTYYHKIIPEWKLRDCVSDTSQQFGEYRRIAIALLKKYGTLPEIGVKEIGGLMEIKLGYRLPPSEETFYKLYSWPLRYDFTSDMTQVFTRKMAKKAYLVFRHELEMIGYRFVEE